MSTDTEIKAALERYAAVMYHTARPKPRGANFVVNLKAGGRAALAAENRRYACQSTRGPTMKHLTETYIEGMDMHTVVECVNCHKRISAKHAKSDHQWERSVNSFLAKECTHNMALARGRTPAA